MRSADELDGYSDLDEEESGQGLPAFLLDPMGILRRRWKLMCSVFLLGLMGTGAVGYVLEPKYTARATVLVASQRIAEDFFRPTVENDQIEKMSAILGEILSRSSLARLIQEHDLYAAQSDEITLEERVGRMRSAISISPEPMAGPAPRRRESSAVVYGIRFTSTSPEKAAAVSNSLARSFTNTHLEMRGRQARLATNFLRAELKEVEAELAQQERAITEFKQKYRGQLPGELQTNLGRLDRLQQQRQSLALQIAETETRMATLDQAEQLDPSSPRGRLAALQAEYERRIAIYTPEHPSVVTLARQIASLEAEIAASGEPAPSASRAPAPPSTLEELRRQLAQTEEEFAELDRRVAMIPQRQEQLDALEQRAEVLRENHQEFLRKVSQAELAEAVESAQQGERAMVLDTAVPPRKPDRSPLLVIAAGLVGSLGLSVGLGLLREILDGVVLDSDEFEREFRVRVLGSVPRIQ